MPIRPVKFGAAVIYIEVTDETAPAGTPAQLDGDLQRGNLSGSNVSAIDAAADRADNVRSVLETVLAPIADAVRKSGPREWTVELGFGFEGSAGIPFLTTAKANASIKVTAKWTQQESAR